MYLKIMMLLKDQGYKVLAGLLCVALAGGMYLKWRGDLLESGFQECTTERDAADNAANLKVIEEYKLRLYEHELEKEKLNHALSIYAAVEPVVIDRVRVRIQKEACDIGNTHARNESSGTGSTQDFIEAELSQGITRRIESIMRDVQETQKLGGTCALKMEANQKAKKGRNNES